MKGLQPPAVAARRLQQRDRRVGGGNRRSQSRAGRMSKGDGMPAMALGTTTIENIVAHDAAALEKDLASIRAGCAGDAARRAADRHPAAADARRPGGGHSAAHPGDQLRTHPRGPRAADGELRGAESHAQGRSPTCARASPAWASTCCVRASLAYAHAPALAGALGQGHPPAPGSAVGTQRLDRRGVVRHRAQVHHGESRRGLPRRPHARRGQAVRADARGALPVRVARPHQVRRASCASGMRSSRRPSSPAGASMPKSSTPSCSTRT